jgi:hypothetical protein
MGRLISCLRQGDITTPHLIWLWRLGSALVGGKKLLPTGKGAVRVDRRREFWKDVCREIEDGGGIAERGRRGGIADCLFVKLFGWRSP